METIKKQKIREQFSQAQLESNIKLFEQEMLNIIKDKNYQLLVNNVLVNDLNIKYNLNDLSKNARKNIAKRLHYFNLRKSIKTMNMFFHVLKKMGVINDLVKIKLSERELEINRLRNVYKIMRNKTEEARLKYKEVKGDFYK